jgi:hypothetical protein
VQLPLPGLYLPAIFLVELEIRASGEIRNSVD